MKIKFLAIFTCITLNSCANFTGDHAIKMAETIAPYIVQTQK